MKIAAVITGSQVNTNGEFVTTFNFTRLTEEGITTGNGQSVIFPGTGADEDNVNSALVAAVRAAAGDTEETATVLVMGGASALV